MKTILLVETVEQDRILIDESIKKRTNYHLIHARDGKTALDVLASSQPDLVIINLDIPQANYLRLIIKYISKDYFKCPVITLASHYNAETKTRLDKLGVFKHLEKPIDPKTLVDNIEAELYLRPKSRISGIATATLFQLIKLDAKTCTLRIVHQNKIGVLYFQKGNITDAVTAKLSGIEAAIEITSWDPIMIIMQEYCRKKKPMIAASMEFILLESARKKDEHGYESILADTVFQEEDFDKFTFDAHPDSPVNILTDTEESPVFSSYTDIEYFWTELEDVVKAESKDIALQRLSELESLLADPVSGFAVLAHDGRVLARKDFNGNYGKFIMHAAPNIAELKDLFDFDNPVFCQLSLLNNQKLLVLIGRMVIIGIIISSKEPLESSLLTPQILPDLSVAAT